MSDVFVGGFWRSFGLQRAWKTTSASGRTHSKDGDLNVTFCALPIWLKLNEITSQEEEGDQSSYADMDVGFRVSKCYCAFEISMPALLILTFLAVWTKLTLIYFLSKSSGFHRFWQSFRWQNKRDWAQPCSSMPRWYQKVRISSLFYSYRQEVA